MKRRLAIVAAATGLLAVSGTSIAQALPSAPEGPSMRADTSGCAVLFPRAANPITICLFPR